MSSQGNKFLSPTTVSLIFALILAVLGIGTATAIVFKVRLATDLTITPVTNTTQMPLTTGEPKLPTIGGEEPVQTKKEAYSRRYVGGLWKYELNGRRTLIKQDGNDLEFYVDDAERGQIRVGRGVVTEEGVQATIDVRSKNRSADMNLRLSQDGKRLEGWFVGVDADEGGHVALVKVG